jgi:hypothetical protein
MRRLLVPLAGVCLCVCAASAAQETKSVQGTVQTVAADSITVTVNEKPMTFKVDSKTDVTAKGASTATRAARAEGKPGVTLTELIKPGQGVEVRYHADMHAASIRALPAVPSRVSVEGRASTASGVVTAVSGSSLTIKGDGGELTFTIDPQTAVVASGAGTETREKKAAGEKPTIGDFVASGDTVSVQYRETGGTRTASEVRVTRKRAS